MDVIVAYGVQRGGGMGLQIAVSIDFKSEYLVRNLQKMFVLKSVVYVIIFKVCS